MNRDQPSIPTAHFLLELKRAMEVWLKAGATGERLKLLRCHAKASRPWATMLEAFENHDEDEDWMISWCENSIPLL